VKRWKIRVKLLWCALRGHPKAQCVAGWAIHCPRCQELEDSLKTLVANKLELQTEMERVELEKLQASSMLLRGRTTISFGHVNNMVMIYFDTFTLNLGLTDEHIEWFIANLRAEQEKLKNETSAG
jgi:hypothetical protein